MAKYRKKPVVIEAVQFTHESLDEVLEFGGGKVTERNHYERGKEYETLFIHTLEGTMSATVGDFIICGVNGEFYPCKPDIFAKTYELVEPVAAKDGQ